MKNLSQYITEKFISELYHFTCSDTLVDILAMNKWKTSQGDTRDKEINRENGHYRRYVSFTRVRDSRFGYSGHEELNTRITFDGDKLSQIMKIRPVDFHASQGKYIMYTPSQWYERDKNWRLHATGTYVENEERGFTNKTWIEDIVDYIRRVDVFYETPEDAEEEVPALKKSLGNKLNVYIGVDEWRAFSSGK